MQCPNQYEWELYADGELPLTQQEELKNHLAECPSCNGLVAALRQESALISEALAATPFPPDLAAIIERRLTATGENSGRWLWFFLPMLGLTGLLAALFTGWLPLLEKLRAILNLLGFGDLLLQLILFTAGIMGGLAEAAMRGKSVMPALAVFVLCILWMQLKIRKGGSAHV